MILQTLQIIDQSHCYHQFKKYLKESFYTSQYGFRTEHSTVFAALEIIDRLINKMDSGETPNIYLDLSKAFDTIDHDILKHKLKHYGITGTALNLFDNYLVE